MNLINEQSFDFKKNNHHKEEYKTKLKNKNFYIFICAVISLSIGIFIHELQKTEEQMNIQQLETLHNDYIKNLTQNADLMYNGKTSMVYDYVKLGKAIKAQDEDSILMYYTLLKSRKDISTMAYMSNFDVEVFSTHSFRIGKKIQLDPKNNDSTTKSYKLSEKLIDKMKTVYLSRQYPDNLQLNHNCDEKIDFCYYTKQASNIIQNDNITNYANNYKKLQEIMK